MVSIKEVTYRVERYDTTSIRVYNTDTEEYETAKPLLREINIEKNLGVDLKNSRGNNKNTRTLGKDIIVALKEQNKEHIQESESI